jgi:hypothetical protein
MTGCEVRKAEVMESGMRLRAHDLGNFHVRDARPRVAWQTISKV